MSDAIVVDANIAFKALIRNRGDLRSRIRRRKQTLFFSPRFLFVELFKYKDLLLSQTGLEEDELLSALGELLSRVEFVSETSILIGTWMEAYRLCRDVDEKDTPYVALALYARAEIWTDDRELKDGLRAKGSITSSIPKMSKAGAVKTVFNAEARRIDTCPLKASHSRIG